MTTAETERVELERGMDIEWGSEDAKRGARLVDFARAKTKGEVFGLTTCSVPFQVELFVRKEGERVSIGKTLRANPASLYRTIALNECVLPKIEHWPDASIGERVRISSRVEARSASGFEAVGFVAGIVSRFVIDIPAPHDETRESELEIEDATIIRLDEERRSRCHKLIGQMLTDPQNRSAGIVQAVCPHEGIAVLTPDWEAPGSRFYLSDSGVETDHLVRVSSFEFDDVTGLLRTSPRPLDADEGVGASDDVIGWEKNEGDALDEEVERELDLRQAS